MLMDVEVKNITKKFGNIPAVNNLSFKVKTGEILGFLGPNGAGKSTTMKIITGYYLPDVGNVLIGGTSIKSNPLFAKAHIGYLPESNPLYLDLNVIDYLQFCASLHGMSKDNFQLRIAHMIKRCGLRSQQHKIISELSKGYRQRVGLAQALVHDPEILILDEPTTGLDPNQIVEIRQLIKEIGKEKTVLLSSHILKEVEATCDRIIIINNGKLVSEEKEADYVLQDKLKHFIVRLSAENVNDVYNSLSSLEYTENLALSNVEKNILELTCSAKSNFENDLFDICVKHKWYILELKVKEEDLADKFRKLTRN